MGAEINTSESCRGRCSGWDECRAHRGILCFVSVLVPSFLSFGKAVTLPPLSRGAERRSLYPMASMMRPLTVAGIRAPRGVTGKEPRWLNA